MFLGGEASSAKEIQGHREGEDLGTEEGLENLSSALAQGCLQGAFAGCPPLLSPDDQDWQSQGPGSGRERAQGGALPQRPVGPGAGERLRGQPPTLVNSWATPTAGWPRPHCPPLPHSSLLRVEWWSVKQVVLFHPIPRRIPFRALGRGRGRQERGAGGQVSAPPSRKPAPWRLEPLLAKCFLRGALVKGEEGPRHCPQAWESAAPPLPPPPERWAGIED